MAKNALTNSDLARPVGQEHRLAAVSQQVQPSAVATLLKGGSPSNVARLVVPVVVDPVNAVLWTGTASYVCQESRKGLVPFVADGDSAPSVVLEIRMRTHVATRSQAAPHVVFRHLGYERLRSASDRFADYFGPAASARNRMAAPEIAKNSPRFISAVASAEQAPDARSDRFGSGVGETAKAVTLRDFDSLHA